MKGHVGSDGNYWLGLSRLEMHYLVMVLEDADVSFMTDQTIGRINQIRNRVAQLYKRGEAFDAEVLKGGGRP